MQTPPPQIQKTPHTPKHKPKLATHFSSHHLGLALSSLPVTCKKKEKAIYIFHSFHFFLSLYWLFLLLVAIWLPHGGLPLHLRCDPTGAVCRAGVPLKQYVHLLGPDLKEHGVGTSLKPGGTRSGYGIYEAACCVVYLPEALNEGGKAFPPPFHSVPATFLLFTCPQCSTPQFWCRRMSKMSVLNISFPAHLHIGSTHKKVSGSYPKCCFIDAHVWGKMQRN